MVTYSSKSTSRPTALQVPTVVVKTEIESQPTAELLGAGSGGDSLAIGPLCFTSKKRRMESGDKLKSSVKRQKVASDDCCALLAGSICSSTDICITPKEEKVFAFPAGDRRKDDMCMASLAAVDYKMPYLTVSFADADINPCPSESVMEDIWPPAIVPVAENICDAELSAIWHETTVVSSSETVDDILRNESE